MSLQSLFGNFEQGGSEDRRETGRRVLERARDNTQNQLRQNQAAADAIMREIGTLRTNLCALVHSGHAQSHAGRQLQSRLRTLADQHRNKTTKIAQLSMTVRQLSEQHEALEDNSLQEEATHALRSTNAFVSQNVVQSTQEFGDAVRESGQQLGEVHGTREEMFTDLQQSLAGIDEARAKQYDTVNYETANLNSNAAESLLAQLDDTFGPAYDSDAHTATDQYEDVPVDAPRSGTYGNQHTINGRASARSASRTSTDAASTTRNRSASSNQTYTDYAPAMPAAPSNEPRQGGSTGGYNALLALPN